MVSRVIMVVWDCFPAGGATMPAIVSFPTLVQQALEAFGSIFECEPQRTHFAEYLTGLLIADRKSVLGIHSEFAKTTDQSCLNRFLTDAKWDVSKLNLQRLEWMQQDPSTRYHSKGVIPIDNVLIAHHGTLIEDVGWFWDHAEDRYKIAHDYLLVNYVTPNNKHYPLEFRRFQKEEQCQHHNTPFKNHTQLCLELIDFVCQQQIPGVFAMDSYFTNAEILNHIHQQKDKQNQPRGYVGRLKSNRKVQFRGQEMSIEQLAKSIDPSLRKRQGKGTSQQWYFCTTLHIPKVNHKVRVVLIWNHKADTEVAVVLVSNRIYWEANRIVRTYRKRWTGTETFHRDAKQELGMGDCQLRSSQGQTRHMYLVITAYSLLMRNLNNNCSRKWAFGRLKTIGQACHSVFKEILRTTITWVVDQVTDSTTDLTRCFRWLQLT